MVSPLEQNDFLTIDDVDDFDWVQRQLNCVSIRSFFHVVRVAEIPTTLDLDLVNLSLAGRRVLNQDVERDEGNDCLIASRLRFRYQPFDKLPHAAAVKDAARFLRTL